MSLKKFKKALALFLCLCLFSGTVSLGASAEENAVDSAAAELKTAWQNMTETVSSNFYPLAYHINDNFNGDLGSIFYGSETAPFDATYKMLGQYYAKFNFIAANQEAHLIGFFKDKQHHSYGNADLTQYKDMYFYLYISNVNVQGTIKPVFFDKTENKNITGKEIAIDESVVGKWIKISAADMFDGGYDYVKSSLGNSLKIVRLSVSDGLNADAVIGSIMFEKQSTELPLLATNAQYMKKAQELDVNAYGNTEEFLSLLSTNRAGHCRSDETIDITDLIRLKKYLASTKDGNDSTVEINKIAADVNFDEEINAQDLAALRKLLLG